MISQCKKIRFGCLLDFKKMHAVSYVLCLILWTYFSTVTNAGCPGSSIPKNLNNEQLPNTKETYGDGESLRLPCQPGYAGYVRITCTDDVWTISGKRRCDPKQCGHPGDTPHGDFILTRGEDFVFGSQVEYTCKKGFILAGKVNHRSCMDQGWDNTVPICEVVKCRPVPQNGDLVASGNTESPQYGDIVQFECRTDDKKIDGEKQIHCIDTGEWSASFPKCVEVSCKLPVIPHGQVTSPKEIYKKDEVLSFSCGERYVPVGRGSSTCTHHDWRPKPQCEEIVCRVEPLADIQPKTKAIFYPGETAKVVCKPPKRTRSKKLQDTVTCGMNGWSSSIFCEDTYCNIRPEDNVSWGYRRSYSYREQLSYYACNDGFKKSGPSVCEIEGWVPPLCKAITCDPEIPHARILSPIKEYTFNERLEYECDPFHTPEGRQETYCRETGWERKPVCRAREGFCERPVLDNGYHITDKRNPSVIYHGCNPGYKSTLEGWWGELKCTDDVWSGNPKCIDETKCVPPTILNARQKEVKDVYSNGELLEYECDDGYKMESNHWIKCVNGSWESPLPICKPSYKMCDPPSRVEYATITSSYKTKYTHLSEVEFECTEFHEMVGNSKVKCTHGTWSTAPKCIGSKCSSPEDKVNNAVLAQKKEVIYENGAEVRYECENATFIPEDKMKATCVNGNWQYPHCKRKAYCEKPDVSNGYLPSEKETYKEGEKLEYGCYDPCEPKSLSSVTCRDGQWDGPVGCTCGETTGKKTCGKPPIPENGDILSEDVEDGETVIVYQCKLHYKLKEEGKVKCHMGEWKPSPVCIGPCVIEKIDSKYNLQNPRGKTYILHGDTHTLSCIRNYYINSYWEREIEVKCQDGKITGYKSCRYYGDF